MSKFNPFSRLDKTPIQPPFLVCNATHLWRLLRQPELLDVNARGQVRAEAEQVVERHRQRMAAQGMEINVPRQESPLIAMSVVGLAFDQQELLQEALLGRVRRLLLRRYSARA